MPQKTIFSQQNEGISWLKSYEREVLSNFSSHYNIELLQFDPRFYLEVSGNCIHIIEINQYQTWFKVCLSEHDSSKGFNLFLTGYGYFRDFNELYNDHIYYDFKKFCILNIDKISLKGGLLCIEPSALLLHTDSD